jgi:hypothetical protein
VTLLMSSFLKFQFPAMLFPLPYSIIPLFVDACTHPGSKSIIWI